MFNEFLRKVELQPQGAEDAMAREFREQFRRFVRNTINTKVRQAKNLIYKNLSE
jgi:hypothetical protein